MGANQTKRPEKVDLLVFFLKMNSRFTFTSLISPLNYSGQLLLDATGRSCVNNKIERLLGKSEIRKFLGS